MTPIAHKNKKPREKVTPVGHLEDRIFFFFEEKEKEVVVLEW